MSSTLRTPPPTVSGMKHCSAVRCDHVVERRAILGRGGDIEKAQLVGTLGVVDPRLLDRIAGIDEIDEVDALDDAAVLDVEAGDDAHLQHALTSAIAERGGEIDPPVIECAAEDRAGDAVGSHAP